MFGYGLLRREHRLRSGLTRDQVQNLIGDWVCCHEGGYGLGIGSFGLEARTGASTLGMYGWFSGASGRTEKRGTGQISRGLTSRFSIGGSPATIQTEMQ